MKTYLYFVVAGHIKFAQGIVVQHYFYVALLLRLHYNSGYANAPQCSVARS